MAGTDIWPLSSGDWRLTSRIVVIGSGEFHCISTMDFTLDKKLQGFRQIAQEKLQTILCAIPDNQKDLVIEPCLIKPLEHICGASWLRYAVPQSLATIELDRL